MTKHSITLTHHDVGSQREEFLIREIERLRAELRQLREIRERLMRDDAEKLRIDSGGPGEPGPEIADQDRETVEKYLGVFLRYMGRNDPNTAAMDNARHAAEMMLAAERARCAAIVRLWKSPRRGIAVSRHPGEMLDTILGEIEPGDDAGRGG
jgi:hypothetical protein